MRLSTVLLALLPACGFSSGSGSGGGDGGGSGNHDGPPDATQCFGSYVRVCFDSAADVPSASVTWSDSVDIDTDSADASSLCNQHNSQDATYCVVAGAGITLAATATLRGHGRKPLVLLSTNAVVLDGIVDVSSTTATLTNLAIVGAGANPSAFCTGQIQAKDSSGGAGGSFAGKGGNGEPVSTSAELPVAATKVTFPGVLRGGCPGGSGAKGDVLGAGGQGGSGGGAVAIIAPSVTMNNRVNASGAGGKGGPLGKSGGGGGGSGGMIVLDVPAAGITRGNSGVLFANGGGGGEGGTDVNGSTLAKSGVDGASPAGPTPSASGGTSGNAGGNGGPGSSDSDTGLNGGTAAVGGADVNGGGGAGGGGAGYIYAPGITGSAVISPASQPSLPAAAAR